MSARARRALLGLVAAMAVPMAAAGDAGPGGRWELSTRVLLPDGAQALPGNTLRQCVGDDGVLAMPLAPDAGCRVVSRDRSGRRLRWLVRCEGPSGAAEIRGDIDWGRDRLSGRLEMRAPDGLVTMEVTGRRLGPCS